MNRSKAAGRMSRARAVARQGLGIVLAVIALFFMMILPLCLARHSQASQVRLAAQSAIIGGRLIDLGRSALAEATARLAVRLDDPADPLFQDTRSRTPRMLKFDEPVRRAVVLAAGDPAFTGCDVAGGVVTLELTSREPLTRLDYEARATWKLSVTTRHRATGISRTLGESRSMRLALVSTPRPYDQFTVLVLQAHSLVGYPYINDWIDLSQSALDRLRDPDRAEMLRLVTTEVDYVNRRLEEANQKLPESEKIEPFKPGEYTSKLDGAALPPARTVSSSVSAPLHRIPDRYSVGSLASRVDDLASLDLVAQLDAPRAAIPAASRSYDAAREKLRAVLKKIRKLADTETKVSDQKKVREEAEGLKKELASVLDEVVRELENAASVHDRVLQTVKLYEDRWVETSGTATDWLVGFSYKLAPEDWAKRAFVRFDGPDATARLTAFLDRYERESPRRPISGVAFVDNGKTPLVLSSRTFHGKLVIVATGAVELRDVTLADRTNDLLVVQAEGPLSVAGRVDASLIVRGAFTPAQGAELGGPLVFWKTPERGRLTGSVTSDDGRYFSGVSGAQRPELIYAALSPYATAPTLKCE